MAAKGTRLGGVCPDCGERSWISASSTPFAEPFPDETVTVWGSEKGNPPRCGWCGADMDAPLEILADSAKAKPVQRARL